MTKLLKKSIYPARTAANILFSLYFPVMLAFIILAIDPVYSIAETGIKKPDFSGIFYPADKQELAGLISDFLNNAADIQTEEDIYGLICPHAGYIYSGQVAANNYKQIRNKNYRTVIILSSSHHYILKKAAVYPEGGFETPLGIAEIDRRFTAELLRPGNDFLETNRSAFKKEHAIEVQIPFLQYCLDDFKIVPIIVPHNSYKICTDLAEALRALIGSRQDILVIASSDLSHYHDRFTAEEMDKETLSLILKDRPRELYECVQAGKSEMCGSSAVAALMTLMEISGADKIELAGYATSADSALIKDPDNSRVVGYAAVTFKKRRKNMLTEDQKRHLLNIARNSITEYVNNKKKNQVTSDDKTLLEHRGAFVTINKKDSLRGCIGLIIAERPLVEVVNDMAVQAATADPRFKPVTADELSGISLEISVLSPIEQIHDISKIQVGKHGLIIRKGLNSGLLLPQVATEYDWDREEFLQHTCLKAGLGPDDWKQGADIFIFSAEVFKEKEEEF